jgi:PAS domain S-box-containing protein
MANAEGAPDPADRSARSDVPVQGRLARLFERVRPAPASVRADRATVESEEDRSARPAAAGEVAEREAYWHLFEFAPVGYVVTDETGTVRRANRAAVRLLQTPVELLMDRPLALVVAADERGAFHRAFARVIDAGGAQQWPIRLQPQGRAAVEVMMTVEAVRDTSGAIRLYWIIRDDSERLEGDLL